jgi:hypothetical protein
MTNFKSNQEMVAHIEEHFNQKGLEFKLLSVTHTHTCMHAHALATCPIIVWDAIKSHSAYDNIYFTKLTKKNLIYLTIFVIKLNEFLIMLLVYIM